MQKCSRLFFSGRVQGVGFRFTALNLAKRYKLKGWVKNLPDGRVEIVVEGEADDLDSFVSCLQGKFEGSGVSCEIIVEEEVEGFSDFKIVF